MKQVSYEYVNGLCTDQTRDEVLAENVKKCVKILNEILTDCEKSKVMVDFELVLSNSNRQNQKIRINEVKRIL